MKEGAPKLHQKENDEEPRMPQPDGRHLKKEESHALRNILATVGALGVAYGSYKSLEGYEGQQVEKGKPTAESVQPQVSATSEGIVETKNGQRYTTDAPAASLRPIARPETTDQMNVPSQTEETASQPVLNSEKMQYAESLPVQKELLKWQTWWTVGPQEVAFVGEKDSHPVVEKAPFVERVIDKNGDGNKEYLLSANVDEYGFAAEGIAGEWMRHERAQVATTLGVPSESLQQINVAVEFNAALNKSEEPALVEGIRNGTVQSMADVVRYFGFNEEKPVRGDEQERTRAQYLTEELTFTDDVPSTIQEDVRALVAALAAKESRFDAGLSKNAMTAWGIMQLIDAVRKEHGFDPDYKLSFQEEVEVAGKHFSNIYKRVNHWLTHTVEKVGQEWKNVDRPETFERLRALYPDTEEGERLWEQNVIVPSMINAYNAGSRRIGEAWYQFVKAHSDEELRQWASQGLELFHEFTQFAEADDSNKFTAAYGQDASSYFWSIKAADNADIFTLYRNDG